MAAKHPQILQLTPSNEIKFDGPFDSVVTSFLELHNPSDDRVCFKVKTTAPKCYCVRPNSGVISPGQKTKIAMMLQPNSVDSQSERNKHKFMVQSTVIRDDNVNIETLWRETTPDAIMDSKLRCVFLTPSLDAADSTTKSANTNISSLAKSRILETQPQQQSTTSSSKSQQAESADSEATSRPKEPAPAPPRNSPSNVASQNLRKTQFDADRSVASSHNMTASSFLQTTGDDYKIILISLAMLFIGVILGKYVI